jgi:uroporphyrinogen-III synthase
MLVLVTRPREQASTTVALLEARGHRALVDPVLQVVPLPLPKVDPGGIAALLLTSANTVPLLPPDLRSLPMLAVGEATAAAARAVGCTVLAVGTEDGRRLAGLAASMLPRHGGTLLHPGAAEPRPGLAEALLAEGYDYRHLALYRTEPSTCLGEETRAALREEVLDAALFFSPRTAVVWRRLLIEAGLQPLVRRMMAISLSEAVAVELRPLGWRALLVADRRDQEALIGCLDALDR